MTRARTRKAPANGPTALYRFFDSEGRLLYVGISMDVQKRWKVHETERATTWWPRVDRRTVEWFDTRNEALAAEVTAIKKESPLHNVMHTHRNRRPYGNRAGTVTPENVSRTRGVLIMDAAKQHFPEAPFTQLDILPLVPLCRSAVTQNFRALKVRGEIVAVGHRTDGRAGLGHTLYALAGSRLSLAANPIREVSEKAREISAQRAAKKTTPRTGGQRQTSGAGWVYGSYPTAAAARTLSTAIATFGERPFSRPDLANLMGLSMPSIIKHVVSLEHHGFIKCVGREPLVGRSGHPPKLYVATGQIPDVVCRSTRKAVPKPVRPNADRYSERHPVYLAASSTFGESEFTVTQLADVLGMTAQAAGRHVRLLASVGLLFQVGWEQRTGPGGRARVWKALTAAS